MLGILIMCLSVAFLILPRTPITTGTVKVLRCHIFISGSSYFLLVLRNFLILYALTPDIGLGVRVFANGPGDLGSIPGRVIPKTQKMVLDASLLNTQHFKVRIKGKVEQFREGVAPSPTHWCSSYRKGSLRVTLDYGRQLYLLLYALISVDIDILMRKHLFFSP